MAADSTIGRGVIQLEANASGLTAAINDAKRSIKSLGDTAGAVSRSQSASIDRYVKGLQTSAAVQGRTTRETELYKLALRGATDEQLRAANSALKLTESYQRGLAIGDKLRSNARAVGQGLVAIGVAAGVGALAFDRLVKNAGNFQDISEKIGDSAESVASLAVAAGTTGAAMDSIAGASVKLTKALTGVDDESKGAGAAVAALGLDLASFKQLAPVDQLEGIAKALNGFADGPEKAAIAMALFGKAGADLLPFLKELGQEGGRQVVLTSAQIKAADEYTDSQAKLRTEIGLYAQAIASDALPVISDFIKGAKDLITEVSGIGTEASRLRSNTSIADFAESGALFLAQLIDIARRVGQAFSYVGQTIGVTAAIAAAASRGSVDATKAAFSFDPSGVVDVATRQAREIATIVKSAREQGEKEFGAFNSFADKVETTIANRKKSTAEIASQSAFPGDARLYRKPPEDRPKIDTRGLKGGIKGGSRSSSGSDPAAREAEQIRRAELDADLRFLRDKLGEERATIAFNERERQALYQAGNASLREFYAERKGEIARGVQAELNLLTDEQARLEVELGRVKDPSERIRLQGQLDESVKRSGNVAVEAARAARLGTLEEEAAFKQLNDTVTDYRANLLQLQGDEEGASRLRAQQAIEQARVLARQSGGQISEKDEKAYAVATDQQLRLNAAKTASSAINQRLQMQEERIALAHRTGAITEIAAMQQIGAARTASVAASEAQVRELQKIADERPFDIQVNLDLEKAKLDLENLYASLDPLKEKFDEVFRQAGSGAIADFIDGTKSAKEALKGFGKEILSSINATVAKQASEQLFGKDGILGGAGGMVAGLFGGAAKGPAQAAGAILGAPKPAVDTSGIAASFSSLQSAGITPTIDAFTRLQQAADAAAGAVAGGEVARTPGTTGEDSIADLFREPADQSANLSTALADTRKTTIDYSAATAQAASTIASLAGAGSNASTALGLLPSIINAISAASATTSSAGGGSGWIETIFGLAASAYGGSSGMATNNTGTSLPTSGGRAMGGPVSAGSIQPITERGPEILRVGSQQYLMMGSQPGYVTPNSGGGAGGQAQPVVVNANFTINGPTDRRSQQQIVAQLGGEVQRATKRIR